MDSGYFYFRESEGEKRWRKKKEVNMSTSSYSLSLWSNMNMCVGGGERGGGYRANPDFSFSIKDIRRKKTLQFEVRDSERHPLTFISTTSILWKNHTVHYYNVFGNDQLYGVLHGCYNISSVSLQVFPLRLSWFVLSKLKFNSSLKKKKGGLKLDFIHKKISEISFTKTKCELIFFFFA